MSSKTSIQLGLRENRYVFLQDTDIIVEQHTILF
jgi:hypothetical protein